MADDGNIILPIIGYILAILFPLIGFIFGIILYFWKKEEPYYVKHAKYIMIVAVVVFIICFILAFMFGLALIPAMTG